MKKNLVLTGMMGVGKSTIGKRLAKKLRFKFIDLDKLIEKGEKSSIKDIFEIKGENYFRKIEKKIALQELKRSNTVIALGGGAFMNKDIRKGVELSSVSFWLDLNTKALLKRLKNSKKRPLLNKENLPLTVNKIYLERKKFYNQSNYRIKCNTISANEIILTIIKLYENSGNKI